MELSYGVWDEKVYDFRNGQAAEGVELPELTGYAEFAQNNAMRSFIADRGFLVFDHKTQLLDAFWQYMSRAADESCGKCAPCRVGTVQLRDRLQTLRSANNGGRNSIALLDEMQELAAHVGASSLCGLGKSCCRALLAALTHFRAEFERELNAGVAQTAQAGFVYVTAPCIEACPSKVDVPRYIDHIKDGLPLHALAVVLEKYPIVATCGRVCVRYCEDACRRNFAEGAVAIKMLKRYAADASRNTWPSLFSRDLVRASKVSGRRVAIVGAGPAGITCAYHLLLNGVLVDIFEAQDEAGGMAASGIPSYRLPKDIVKQETQSVIEALGGKLHFNRHLGRDFTLDSLFEQAYEAVFLGYGASKGSLLGEHDEPTLNGYLSGIEFLWQVHCHVEDGLPMSLPGDVVVVGGGNVAMDCVRSALRLKARNVHLVYRRTKADMPADEDEIEAAAREGVIFHTLTNPTRVLSEEDHVSGVELVRMQQSGQDRRRVDAVPGSEYTLACSTVIAAIGQQVDSASLRIEDGVLTDRRGCIEVNAETLQTSRAGVFAGGDCVLGAQTLIQAMDHGEMAARSIIQYLQGKELSATPEQRMQKLLDTKHLLSNERVRRQLIPQPRTEVHEIDIPARVGSFAEVEMSITQAEAFTEADRCLRCYRLYSVVMERPL